MSQRAPRGTTPIAGTGSWWPWSILLVAGGIWGSTFALAKVATSEGAHPLGINLWHAAIGGAVLIVCNLIRGRRVPLGKDCLRFYAVAGLLGTVIPNTLFFYAASRVSAGVMYPFALPSAQIRGPST